MIRVALLGVVLAACGCGVATQTPATLKDAKPTPKAEPDNVAPMPREAKRG